ncbi:MAG TPA: prolyl oligopeptidase family serine peptidase [Bacteroidales bacterium]|nr:prolyl oligopeptidase family serine peptidase [Bacteroidales bacterium]
MKTKTFIVFLSFFLLVQCSTNEKRLKPPLAPVKPVTDEYFGVKITDPYRYMENLQDTTVRQWMKQQSDYSRKILNSIPGRQRMINMMVDFDKRKSSTISSLRIIDNDRYFYLKMTPADETGKLYYRDGFEGKEILMFDPKTYSQDTTKKYVISSVNPSIDGSKVAIDIAPNGSESAVLLTIETETLYLYPEKIDRRFGGFPVSWLADNNSFLYNRLQSDDVHDANREKDSKTYLHIVGKDPSTDMEVFSRSNNPELGIKPEELPFVFYDKDSKFLFGQIVTVDNRINLYYAPSSDLGKQKIAWLHLIKPEDEVYDFFTTDKDFYLYTPKNAPNFKILKTSFEKPDLKNAEVIVSEDPERKMTNYSITSEGLLYTLSDNGIKETLFFLPKAEKTAKEIELPFVAGTVRLSSKGYKFADCWAGLTGWTSDYQRFRYIPQKNEFKLENLSSVAEYPEYKDLTVEELMIPSHDGVNVPLSLIYNKSIKKTGNNPVLFYGYGAYGMSITPGFSSDLLLWTHEGGILAIPHVRGGGELGEKWYRDGYKTTKPNTWKDLIACAEYLVKEQYTSPQKIAINSASAGGILVGRAMTERPDLFAVSIPQVGCLNTVRAEESPNGPVNTPEFGTVKDSVECMALIEMDSYIHVEDGEKYPSTLITAGMNDPRVIAWQPAKFAARLQAANKSDKPILFLVDYEAGHGIGNTKTKIFEEFADVFSFALWQTGHPDYQIK